MENIHNSNNIRCNTSFFGCRLESSTPHYWCLRLDLAAFNDHQCHWSVCYNCSYHKTWTIEFLVSPLIKMK